MKKFTEQELKEYAQEQSKTIVIRTYTNGNSKDEKRKATKPERKIIESIIFGGLLAINSGANVQSVADASEYIGNLQIPEMNSYDTIYNPIKDYQKIGNNL